MDLVNWRLLSHPLNWGFVWVVLALAVMAYTLLHNAVTGASGGPFSTLPID